MPLWGGILSVEFYFYIFILQDEEYWKLVLLINTQIRTVQWSIGQLRNLPLSLTNNHWQIEIAENSASHILAWLAVAYCLESRSVNHYRNGQITQLATQIMSA